MWTWAPERAALVSVLEDWQKQCVETPEAWLFANADTKRPVHGDAIQKDYLRLAGEKIGLQGVGWHHLSAHLSNAD